MAIGYFKDIYKATAGQAKFKTSQVFVPKELTVTLNGITVNLGEDHDYIELDNQHIEFTYGLEEGDTVAISNSATSSNMNIDVVGYTGALFPLYGQSQRLMYNQSYGIKIKLKNKLIEWGFTSKYSPLATTVKKVRSAAGGVLDKMTDEQISYMIYQNSKAIELLLTDNDKADELDDSTLSYYKINWTLYKTCIDLIMAVYLTMSGQVGSVSKTIGPVTVDRTYKIPFIQDMLGRFQKTFDQYDGYLKQNNMTNIFVKAGTTTYPVSQRRSF